MGNQRGLGLGFIFVLAFLFSTTFTCLGDGNASVICSEKERLALLKFKESVEDPCGMLSSWVGNDCCLWEGIHCDRTVEGLDLRGYSGCFLDSNEVNPSLAELSHLKHLDLSANNFHKSRIPKFIGSLKQLSYLNLSYADFQGIIPPHIGNLSNLKVLDISSYEDGLMVDDMAWTSGLSSLGHLELNSVHLGGAQKTDTLFYMIPSLKVLSLSWCSLSNADFGPLLNSSRILPHIIRLDLGFNYFEGPLPVFFQNMSSLSFLDLSSSNLSLAWNLANLLSMIPSLSELHLSGCGLDNIHLSSPHLNFSRLSNIQHLVLSENSIEGAFPSVLINMSSLRVLDLSQNMLSSLAPLMPNLLDLDLSYNQLIGPIPTFHMNLSKLDLSFNQLKGSFPESIGNLTALTYLNLDSNRLTGPIPASLGRLVSLQSVRVSSNLLNGSIPVSIGRLSKLQYLDFSNNSLEGVVSEAHFANLSMLKYLDASSNTKLTFNVSCDWMPPFQLVVLDLSSCNIVNGFPQWLRNQRKLGWVALSKASISGQLPTWLRKMPIIPRIDLSHNKLNGTLMNLPNGETYGRYIILPVLLLENNLFSGMIPRSLCRRTDLEYLDLSRNRLTGGIPNCLENLQKLYTMILSSNRLSGVIPSSIALNSLYWLKLNDNYFVGELPRELGNLHNLSILDVGDNKLSGNIPEWIGVKLTSLVVLRLHKNNFTGRIPKSLCKAANLQTLDVAHNNLKGPIPPCLGELSAMINNSGSGEVGYYLGNDGIIEEVMKGVDLKYTTTWHMVFNMDLSSNQLVGEIPVELTALSMLVALNLSNNHLIGNIPHTIGDMAKLFSLDLSGNELIGGIPPSISALTFLSHLNLSHNHLSGRIPTGNQLQTLIDPSVYEGNKDLCGPPLPKTCPNHKDPTPTTTIKKKHEAVVEQIKVWLFYVDVICGFATGFWGVIGVLLFKKQWRQKLFMFAEETMDKIYVAVVVRVVKITRGREVA
ncbi:receptor-like protein EIX2 [Lactuca sativa]|uniref:receptor-like protein EIX2 n=1 Tax=Lactuca sativa TaxID=4236 RepID=UPI000CD84697|nr:receptor-like protein EIX2 [Lactuca sativa]